MKRLIDFCLLLLMVFWGSNAWADKTMTFSATSPTNDCAKDKCQNHDFKLISRNEDYKNCIPF